jgi:hypothetical protein
MLRQDTYRPQLSQITCKRKSPPRAGFFVAANIVQRLGNRLKIL